MTVVDLIYLHYKKNILYFVISFPKSSYFDKMENITMESESPESASKKKKSTMWRFFVKNTDRCTVICKHCSSEFKYCNNTSNMKDHLKRKHPELLITLSTSSATESLEETCQIQVKDAQKYAVNSTRKKMLDAKYTKMLAVDMQPLRLSEHEGFKEFVAALDARYELPGRTTLSTKLLPRMYARMKSQLLEIIGKVKHMAITTDTWTSTSNEGILAVTGHFIINKRLQSVLLSALVVEGRHDADNISTVSN